MTKKVTNNTEKKRVVEMPRFRVITQYETDFKNKHTKMRKAMIDDVVNLAIIMVGNK